MNSEPVTNTDVQDQPSIVNYNHKLNSFRAIVISKFIQANAESFKDLDGLTLIIDQDILENESSQKITSQISNLTQLQFFAIHNRWNNILTGLPVQRISNGIATLLNIQELNLSLSNSKLSDVDVEYLFSKISLLTNIQKLTLDFSDNIVQTKGAEHISHCLRQLTKITDLYLNFRNSYLFTFPFDILIVPVSNLPFLKKLHCKFYFNIKLLNSIQQSTYYLKKMVNLTEISIIFVADQMKISDEYSLMNSIGYLINLEKLHFSTTSLQMKEENNNYPHGLPINCCLEKLSKLTSLDLEFSRRKIGEADIFSLSQGIHHLHNLISLNLALNQAIFTDKSSKILGASFIRLTHLKYFKMNLNLARISDKNLDLLKGLVNLDNLTDLALSFWRTIIVRSQIESYFGYFSMLPKLITLNLSFSKTSMDTETGFRKLSQAISKLENLQQFTLELFSIHLNDKDIELFFTDLENLSSHLIHLSLYFWGCQVGLSTVDRLSNGITNLRNLISLGLSIEGIENSLDWSPQAIIKIAQLTKLNTFLTSLKPQKIFNSNFSLLKKKSRNIVNIKRV